MKKDIRLLLTRVEQQLLKSIHEKPSHEALDRLAIFAGYQSWDDFRKEIADEGE